MVARLLKDGDAVTETVLPFEGTVSTYAGTVQATDPGTYQLQVLASDPGNANFGMGEKRIQLR